MFMTLNYRACRNLVAAMIHRGLHDASQGDYVARRWIEGPPGEQWAAQLDIKDWPPKEGCYKRLREERQLRVGWARKGW